MSDEESLQKSIAASRRAGLLKHKKVLDAFMNGAEVEVRYPGGEWKPIGHPGFLPEYEYRIKSTAPREVWMNVGKEGQLYGPYMAAGIAVAAASSHHGRYSRIAVRYVEQEDDMK